ncbi:uncharacterized protein METZ01_LOCUS301428, partial [marine metagenome]
LANTYLGWSGKDSSLIVVDLFDAATLAKLALVNLSEQIISECNAGLYPYTNQARLQLPNPSISRYYIRASGAGRMCHRP